MPVFNHIPKVEGDMQGATETAAGKAGLVPAPSAGKKDRALMADGTWKRVARVEENGLIKKVGNIIAFYTSDEQELANGSMACDERGNFIFGGGTLDNCSNSFMIGAANELTKSNDSFVSGTYNQVSGLRESAVLGGDNKINATGVSMHNFISGYKNEMSGEVESSGIIGENLEMSPAERKIGIFIIGKYNDYKEDSIFEVGSGTSDTNRADAFRVTEDGTGYVLKEVVVGCMDKKELCEQIRAVGRNVNAYRVSSSGKSLIPGMLILNNETNSAGEYCGGTQLSGIVQALETTAQGKAFYPVEDLGSTLGRAGERWKAIYAGTSTITTSDKNLKKDINPFTEAYEELFFDLEPSIFKLKDGKSNRTHAGFISNDVEKALEKNGLSALDFAGFCKDKKIETVVDENGEEKEVPVEGEYVYSLRYEEFIALNTHMIQKLYSKVESLEQKLRENGIEV